MPRLYLIRHAEPAAVWGAGDPDPGLSELGRAQAADAAYKLGALKPALAFTSPLLRCVETAAAFQMETGIEPYPEKLFGEVVAPPEAPDRRAWLQATFPGIAGAGATRWGDLDVELRRWRANLVESLRIIGSDAAIFSHFIAINAIASYALGKEDTIVFRPAHASITTLDVDGEDLRLAALGAETAAVSIL